MADTFKVGRDVGQIQKDTNNSSQVNGSDITTITMADLRQIRRESILWSIGFAIVTGIISSLIFELYIKVFFITP